MDSRFSSDEHIRRGRAALDANEAEAALHHFRAAHRLDPQSPRTRSFYGLCVGLVERRFDRALELCRSAAKEEFFNPMLYRNLAQVHRAFGFKAEGIRLRRRGLMIDPEDGGLRDDVRRLGQRREPVLAFLRRRNRFNRWLGRMRARLGGVPSEPGPSGA